MYLTYETVNTCTRELLHFEKRTEERQVHELILPLEVLAIVPLNNGVLELTHSVGVTVNLQNSVNHSPLLSVVAVSQHCICRRLSQNGWEPLNGVNVYHTLHVE